MAADAEGAPCGEEVVIQEVRCRSSVEFRHDYEEGTGLYLLIVRDEQDVADVVRLFAFKEVSFYNATAVE